MVVNGIRAFTRPLIVDMTRVNECWKQIHVCAAAAHFGRRVTRQDRKFVANIIRKVIDM